MIKKLINKIVSLIGYSFEKKYDEKTYLNNLLKQKKIKIIQVEIIFQDIYSKYLNIYDIEKYLIPNSYRLLATNKFGNLIDNYSFQMDILYTTKDEYKKISKN